MTFFGAVSSAFKNYANFSGRARRKEYWYFVLFNIIVSIILVFIPFAPILWGLITFIPGLALVARRLHDVGKSAWFYLIILIPLIGSIILLIFLLTDSEVGNNKWGPNPKGIE